MLAIIYRTVGGFIGMGSTFLCRLRFSILIGLYWSFLCVTHHQNTLTALYVFLATTLCAYLGRLISHGKYISEASLKNTFFMSLIGLARLSLIMLPYSIIGRESIDLSIIAVSIFGLGEGVSYFIGLKFLDQKDSGIYYRNKHSQWLIHGEIESKPEEDLDQAAVGGSEWGELLTGVISYQIPYAVLLAL